jgi:hypothetical protein
MLWLLSFPALQFCCQMVADDVTGGGKLETGNGDGTFRAIVPYGAPGEVFSGNLAADDFNSDGVGDIALAGQSPSGTAASLYLSVPTPIVFPADSTSEG